MIIPSITSLNAAEPLNLVNVVIERILPLPAALRRFVLWILPGRVHEGTGLMPFHQDYTRDQWSAAYHAAYNAGTVLWPYIGSDGIPNLAKAKAETDKYHWAAGRVGFDNAAAYDAASKPAAVCKRELISDDAPAILIEANRRQDWIVRLMDRFGPRVGVMADYRLLEDGRAGAATERMSVDEIEGHGGDAFVSVRKGLPTPQERFAKALEWEPIATVLLNCAGMNSDQLNHLAGLNTAGVR